MRYLDHTWVSDDDVVARKKVKRIQIRGMANAVEDERSLLEAIKVSLGSYSIYPQISQLIYPYTSYILKNVIKFRLDVLEEDVLEEIETVAGSDESAITEFDFRKSDFEDISKILKEIEKASSAEMDEHKFALSLPSVLDKMNYNMNFILVGTLASFAVSHGVWLLVLSFISADSSKEEIMIVLKKVEGLFITLRRNLEKQEDKNHFDFYLYISLLSSSVTRMPNANWESMGSLYNLTKAMFEVTSAAHMFLKDVSQFIPKKRKNDFDDLMLLSIYWVTRGVFSCYSVCRNLPKNGYIIHDPLNLEYIREKLVSILQWLQIFDGIGKRYMEDEKLVNAYQIPNKVGKDNYFALMALFGLQPGESEEVKLSHCSKMKIDVSLTTLRHKSLVLIISGLNISSHLIDLLQDIYEKLNCEFIWLPINSGSWNTSLEGQFMKLVQMMPWYTVQHPTTISEETKRFIRDKWKFHRKPIVVVLNEDGNVVCANAIHIMCLWGAEAFPFTRMSERTLWTDELTHYPGSTTLMRFLFLGLDYPDELTHLYMRSDYVIIYGGNDTAWIQKFANCIRGASADSGAYLRTICIPINEEIRKSISTLFEDKKPQTYKKNILFNSKQIWYFWIRLESILISKGLSIDASEYSRDLIIQKVKELLCYSSVESWACLIEPSSDGFMVHSLGNLMLQAFMEPNVRKQLPSKDFKNILHNYIEHQREVQGEDYPCSRIVLNNDNSDVVQVLECPHCKHIMEKKIQYRCCHVDDDELA